MKKVSLFIFGVATCMLANCGDKVSDPEALYQHYLKDNAARTAKVSECRLLSVDEQQKKQTCTIALKADADLQMKNKARTNWQPVEIDLGSKKTPSKKE